LTGWALAEARKTLDVEVAVMVGSSTSNRVAVAAGVRVELLEVGVSSTGADVEAGVAVG